MLTGPWSLALTAIFAGAGAYCLWQWTNRLATPRSGRDPGAAAADLNHVVMCLAMVLMVWWPSGPVGTAVQVGVFTVLGLILLARAVRDSGAGRVDTVAHVGMNAAMVWMLAAMPLLMGGPAEGSAGGHHHGSAPVADPAAAPVPAPGWVLPVNSAVAVAMALIAVWWAIRAIRRRDHRVPAGCHAAMGAGMAIMLGALH